MLEKRHTARLVGRVREPSTPLSFADRRWCARNGCEPGRVRVKLQHVSSAVRLTNIARRTLLAFFPRFARPDDAFAQTYLPPAELRLYLNMDPRDRCHALEVASALLNEHPQASSRLVRAALLHDVGKSGERFSAVERVAVHLYTPDVPAEPRFGGLRGAWQRRRHHAAYGANLVRKNGGDACVALIVERHHVPGDNAEALILKNIEERF